MEKIGKAVLYKEKVYEEIKASIIAQKLKSGEVLNERRIADILGVSRTPVREALQMLENEGWVVTEAWKGTIVRSISRQDIKEIFQLRIVLENLAAEIAAGIINDDQLQYIENIYREQEGLKLSGEGDTFIRIDHKFHMYIVGLMNNQRIYNIMANTSDMMMRIGVEAIRKSKRMEETMAEHLSIIDALKTRNSAKAREAMNYHLLNTQEIVCENFHFV